MKTRSKETMYDIAFNFPAFLYTFKKESWENFQRLYFKLLDCSDKNIDTTLSSSIHEIASLIGEQETTEMLLPYIMSYLQSRNVIVRENVLTNLHLTLKYIHPSKRDQFMKKISDVFAKNQQKNWRT